MKNKLCKVVVGTFAMVAALSAMPVASMDAAACNDDVAVCAECQHPNYEIVDIVPSDGWYPAGGDQHVYSVEYHYHCFGCDVRWTEVHNEYGNHTYQYDYSAYEWVCTICGDSYTN